MKWTASGTVFLGVGSLLLMLVGACGGGGGDGTSDSDVRSGSATSVAALDGWVRTDGNYDPTSFGYAGDLDQTVPGQHMTTCYTFDLPALTPASQIVSATLSVDVIGNGGDPYDQHGDMRVWYVPYGNDLANVPTIFVIDPPPAGTFSPSDVGLGTKRANVRSLLQRALDDGYTRLQVQVGFLQPNPAVNGQNDEVLLETGEHTAPGGPLPTLDFEWTDP